jgi:hypothetical protein
MGATLKSYHTCQLLFKLCETGVAYPLLRVEKKGERRRKKKAEELSSGRLIDKHYISNKEPSAR